MILQILILANQLLFPSQARVAGEPPSPFQVTGAMVVSFGPTKGERDSIAAIEGLEIDDMLDDFNLYAGKAGVYVSGRKIPYASTECRLILVKLRDARTRMIDRTTVPGLVGLLLCDGVQEPKIIPGIQSMPDLVTQINEYFHMR